MFQNGGWPVWPSVETDAALLTSDRLNRRLLVGLLKESGEAFVELYGIWAGDFSEEPRIREEISIENILADDFYFKERGFYRVKL